MNPKNVLSSVAGLAGHVVLVLMLAVPAAVLAGGGALPGPSGGGGSGLPLTGGTMTGQVVFNGVATDISTGTDENLTVAPSGTGYLEIAKTAGSVTTDIFSIMTVSDVTTTKWFLRMYNSTSANGTLAPTISGATNSTTATHGGVAIVGVVPDSADVATSDGVVIVDAYESTDGMTGTLSIPESRPLFSVRGGGSVKLNVGVNGELRQVGYSTTLGTCTSSNVAEQKFYSKTAANKISHCVCVMTAAATYAWETTHASGDCT